jgi:hypothetical protein
VRSEARAQWNPSDPDELGRLAGRVRPTTLAGERVLPVAEPLRPLLPTGLVRGTSVQVAGAREGLGSTSLALALLAGPSSAGSWAAVVGVPSLGLPAAAGFGVDLGRLVLVAPPAVDRGAGGQPHEWATVVATLLDAFEVVLARPPAGGARHADARRLAARARARGSVLVRLGSPQAWPQAADVSLTVVATAWEGLGRGHGHLRARRVTVAAGGRRGADRPRRADLWLPGPGGVLASAPPTTPLAEVRPIQRTQPPPGSLPAPDVVARTRPTPVPARRGSCA